MPTCTDCGLTKNLTEFYKHHKGGNFKQCKLCHGIRNKAWKLANIEKVQAARSRADNAGSQKRYRENLKDEVFAAYGGYKCSCCGESEKLFLSIDHVANNGADERRTVLNKNFYRHIRNSGFPPDYQVLCMNCNHGKHRNGGVCPHQVERSTTIESTSQDVLVE